MIRFLTVWSLFLMAGVAHLESKESQSGPEIQPVEFQPAEVLGWMGRVYPIVTAGTNAYSFHYFGNLTDIDAGYLESPVDFCTKYHGRLVTIDSLSKQNLMVRLIKKARRYHGDVFFDATFYPSCDYYKDGNGKIFYQTDLRNALGYANWFPPNEPQVAAGECVAIATYERYKWRAAECWNGQNPAFICEWDRCTRWFGDEARCAKEKGCFYDYEEYGGCIHERP